MSLFPPAIDALPLDLSAYLDRLAYSGSLQPTLETLASLHGAHQAAIPFENLDVQLGVPIRLDLASLQDKLVVRRRGGYCFEQNSLFAVVLGRLGFQVALLEVLAAVFGLNLPPETRFRFQG